MPPRKRRTPKKAEVVAPVTVTALYGPALDTPDGGHQPPLDGMPPLPEKRTARPAKRKPIDSNVIRWARYKVLKPEKCDVCLIEVAAKWDKTPTSAPNPACYRRTQHRKTQYLCWLHTEDQRRRDGLPDLKAGGR